MKVPRTLAEIKADKRVYSVENVQGEDWQDENTKYELSLEDGWVFDDDTSVNRYHSVKEMVDDLAHIRFDARLYKELCET